MTLQVDACCWDRLPGELKALPQWCVAGPDKSPYIAGKDGLYRASPIKGPWLTYETACELAKQYNGKIGIILTEGDPFSCIDLDVKDINSRKANGEAYKEDELTTPEALEFYQETLLRFGSYAELSNSGQGLHIWTLGDIGDGIKNGGIEVYSRERFIVCTGNHLSGLDYHNTAGAISATISNPTPHAINNRQAMLDQFVAGMRAIGAGVKIALTEIEEELTDVELITMAMGAGNADKFDNLCNGEYEQYNYPSQSEADLSLMSMFTFYSKSNAQCRRLFRYSKLGERDKAVRDDVYLDRTLRIVRTRQDKEAEREIALAAHSAQLIQTMSKQIDTVLAPTPPPIPLPQPPANYAPLIEPHLLVPMVQGNPESVPVGEPVAIVPEDKAGEIPWPPGLVGEIAKFIYGSAPRPVKEVSIVAALGLMAGITGKAFTFSQSGLNLYIILIARSAIGKEAMHSGISLLMDRLRQNVPAAQQFVDFSDYASGPALSKGCAENQSFVNIAGEWGRKLKRLSGEDGRDGPMSQLRTVMTNLYQKSGPKSVVGGLAYSNKEQNVASVSGIAYSMIGETTPGTFFDSLTESMMEDGFLSRFNIIEYNGERPGANKTPVTTPHTKLVDDICGVMTQALTVLTRGITVNINFNADAKAMLDAFDAECDSEINATKVEAWRQMWNRAHLKTIRLASVLAVSDNHINPILMIHHVEWALGLVRRDIAIMSNRINSGDIGQGDSARELKMLDIIKQYCEQGAAKSYKIPEAMYQAGVIPRKYMQNKTRTVSSFMNHRTGASNALDGTIRSLVDSGYLMECDKNKVLEAYGPQGRCFRVLNLDGGKENE